MTESLSITPLHAARSFVTSPIRLVRSLPAWDLVRRTPNAVLQFFGLCALWTGVFFLYATPWLFGWVITGAQGNAVGMTIMGSIFYTFPTVAITAAWGNRQWKDEERVLQQRREAPLRRSERIAQMEEELGVGA